MKCIYDLTTQCHKECPEVECYNYDKVNEDVIDNEQPLEMIKFDETDKCHYEDGCKCEFFKELTAPYDVKNMQEFIAVIRAEVIDEFKYAILDKIRFEEKWLMACKSDNADTHIAFSSLISFVKGRAEQLKVGDKE